MNIHTPERQHNETQRVYRNRQRASKRQAQEIALWGPYSTRGGVTSRETLRQEQKKSGTFIAGSFGNGLRNAITRKPIEQRRTRGNRGRNPY